MARILLGVSGGIAAYKALEFVRLATAAGHAVRVVQTPTSRRFVGEASFAALTGAPVLVSEFERDPARGAFPDQQPPAHEPIGHLELVANADIFVFAPATANTLAKLAAGLADNLLTSAALAARCPLVIAPAMNASMYEHPATRANIELLRSRGATVVDPGIGRLASLGEEGVGRLAEPAALLTACEAVLATTDVAAHPSHGDGERAPSAAGGASLAGARVLVTAGGTREPIDSVRYIGNRSSGRMGLALAAAASARGGEVTLVAANVALPEPVGVLRHDVTTAAELEQACRREFAACDVLIMAAAVADFRPAAPADGKIKKAGREHLELQLEATTDVLSELASQRRDGQTLVGFAAEHGDAALDAGEEKLVRKGLDALVVNDISRADIGFDVDANAVTILTRPNGEIERVAVARADKRAIAEAIIDAIGELRAGR